MSPARMGSLRSEEGDVTPVDLFSGATVCGAAVELPPSHPFKGSLRPEEVNELVAAFSRLAEVDAVSMEEDVMLSASLADAVEALSRPSKGSRCSVEEVEPA